ncbi:MAG: 3-oxoacid CoA-transferase subunit B [Eubacteriales bacterium]
MYTGREYIAWRIAQEFKDGDYVNLGIGMPTMVANFIPENVNVMLHSENGVLGLGSKAKEGSEDINCLDAGGNYVTAVDGAAYFDSVLSFSIIRGGHLDITVLGALEVDAEGNLASWMVPGKKVTGMGGAMDLVVGARKVIIAMDHLNKDGQPKILNKCNLPLTAKNQVNMIVTERAVLEIINKQLVLREIAPGYTLQDVIEATEANIIVPEGTI